MGSSDPKSCMEEIEICAKTGARAEDDKTVDETAAEEIRRATERRCLRRERQPVDLDIGDKESGKRHSSDGNTSKRLKTGSGARGNNKADTLPEDHEGGREVEDEEVETWFEV